MGIVRSGLLAGCVVAGLGALAPGAAWAQDACHPFTTPPQLRGSVPTPASLGIPLGERDVTTEESDRYLAAVDEASTRVVTGSMGRSVQNRELRYAVVGRPANVTRAGLARVRAAVRALQDPATPARRARRLAARTPQILWIAGNVHGGEESGTDAALQTLHQLADRTDCVARRMLDTSIVVIAPTQNPDGREADTRQNANGFDMNRDWFARTQPETDAKLELLRRYPPVLFVDDHEMGDTRGFFFPPNADPIYHEVPDRAVDWINDVYGASMQAEFTRQGIPFFNYDLYDLFYQGYGDTVPATAFGAAGMTYEKTSSHDAARRLRDQFVAQWTTLYAAATRRTELLRGWHATWVQALRQGRRGQLEPNFVVQPDNTVQFQVPDETVRHYFLRADDPARSRDVQALVRRLQRMDVEVHRLTAPLTVADFKPHGGARGATTLPAGTYWVPLAQRQKHWVQAMLHEQTYVPFPYFYDVTAWSQPLLFGVQAGRSGAQLQPRAEEMSELPAPPRRAVPEDVAPLGVLQLSTATSARESTGWLRHRLQSDWHLPWRELTAASVAAGALEDVAVLVLPNGPAADGYAALGAAGQAAVRDWVRAGGRLVAYRGGAQLAALLGVTTTTLTPLPAGASVPGALIRAQLAAGSPLAAGVGGSTHLMFEEDALLTPGTPAGAAATYPAADLFISGFATPAAAAAVAGTAAVTDERFGDGRVVLFGSDPNFRAFTDHSAEVLRNALLGGDPPAVAEPPAVGDAVVAAARRARALVGGSETLRLTVGRSSAGAAAAVLGGFGATFATQRGRRHVSFVIANPDQHSGDEHPWARRLPAALRAAGVEVVALRVP